MRQNLKLLSQFDEFLGLLVEGRGQKAWKDIAVSSRQFVDPLVKAALSFPQLCQRDLKNRDPVRRSLVAHWVKAAIAAGSTIDDTNASKLVAFQSLAGAFFESMHSISLLDSILAYCQRIPPGVRIEFISAIGAGHNVAEAAWTPLTKLGFGSFNFSDYAPAKALALVVINDELLKFSGAGDSYVRTELQQACALAADSVVLPNLLSGVTLQSSSGDPRNDMRQLLATVPIRQSSKLLWLTSPDAVGQLALTGGDSGAAFPDISLPNGGSIAGVPLLGLDCLHNYSTDGDLLLLVDCSQIAGDSGDIVLEASQQADIQMVDGPTAAANMVSMFQTNSVALKADREFALKKIRNSCVGAIKQVSYDVGSP